MKTTKLFSTLLAVALMALTACSSDAIEEQEPVIEENEASIYPEAPKCDESVTVEVHNPAGGRASSSFLEENIDRFTATRVDAWHADKYVLASYHGRNKEQIGMVQLLSKDGEVLSELVLRDTRVNYAQYYEGKTESVVFVGVDRKSVKNLCGIIVVPVKDGKFYVGDDNTSAITPYKIEGLSINCLKQQNNNDLNDILVVASGGNDALDQLAEASEGDLGKAGFTKFIINKSDPHTLRVLQQDIDNNYRGYWFSYGTMGKSPIAYTYRKVVDGDLVYMLGAINQDYSKDIFNTKTPNDLLIFNTPEDKVVETEVFRKPGVTSWLGRFNVTSAVIDGRKYIIVSTGDKEGGIQVYRFEAKNADTGLPTLTLTDTYHKQCNCISSEIIVGKTYYLCGACSDGVYKIELREYTMPDGTIGAALVPSTKHKTTVLTESGTLASINYIQAVKTKIYVAGGYEGYYCLDFNKDSDWANTCDPRTDYPEGLN